MLLAALLAWIAPAEASCPATETILDELTCSSTVTGRISWLDASDIGGPCASGDCYTCGTPYANLPQQEAEDVYSFTCQASGEVTLDISGLDCDLDIYILDSSCDPYSGCEDGSTQASTTTDSVTFTCTAGDTYYVVIEGYGFGLSGITRDVCSGPTEGDYTLTFDVSAGTGCSEDCDNGADDDFDGDTDCDDSDCASDPICACDVDGDGYDLYACGGSDCDDSNYYINPGATEYCDGVDNDCDGTTDEAGTPDATTWYRDGDGDGYGDPSVTTRACSAPSGYVANSSDCDDASAAVKPGATETCNGYDDDCDGAVDESGGSTWYRDGDGDGYGTSATTTVSCSAPSGYVSNALDCDDGDAAVSPAEAEVCNAIDDDCDGAVDESGGSTWYLDGDGDGHGTSSSTTVSCSAPSGYTASAGDCNDANAAVHPGASEYCNGVDDDCDGSADEAGAVDETTWYHDGDGDSYGSSTSLTQCSQPSGYVGATGDCDDGDATVYPSAPEICDSQDNDCDGAIDEGAGSTWYADSDADGYGDPTSATVSCARPSGYVGDATDCDDGDAAVNPGATELCNGYDDDCDGVADEDDADDVITWYEDADGDGYGSSSSTDVDCDQPTGFVANDDDCWDGDAGVNPASSESADGVDEDCDGVTDEGTSWYDDDGDGFTEAGGDCDDATTGSAPTAEEECDGEDQDCDGVVDDGTDCFDDDGDGYTEEAGDCNDADGAVSPGTPEAEGNGVDDDCDGAVDAGSFDPDGDGYTAEGGDCDEEAGSVYPGAEEEADGVDNDCDGIVDEGSSGYDDDGDGFSEEADDCDDGDETVNPDAVEVENGVDDDCDGAVDEDTSATDDDGDGYSDDAGDCDDADDAVSPDATEVENGVDDDCDDEVDEGTDDRDGDGYTEADGDCDDLEGWANPGRPEACDGLDNNCDGQVDESCSDEAEEVKPEVDGCGCGSAGGSAAGWPLVLGLLVGLGRRRNGGVRRA